MGKVSHTDRSGDDYSFEGRVELNSKKWNIIITMYKFLPWLALVGGSLTSITGICSFVVTNWNFTDYMRTMIGEFFLVKKHAKIVDDKKKKRETQAYSREMSMYSIKNEEKSMLMGKDET